MIWLRRWNYDLLQLLFHVLPHSPKIDTAFQFLFSNSLVSTWIFAAFFYWFWSQHDARTRFRREQLFQIVVAFGIAVPLTLLVRPWIGWPAPALDPRFQVLYPQYFWRNGSLNSFPSHATLAYSIVALGFWRLNPKLSSFLLIITLVLISLPRIYLGGHYPIDVLASLALAILTVTGVQRWRIPPNISDWLSRTASAAPSREFLAILWIFELGEGFSGLTAILNAVRRLFFR